MSYLYVLAKDLQVGDVEREFRDHYRTVKSIVIPEQRHKLEAPRVLVTWERPGQKDWVSSLHPDAELAIARAS